jgi:TPR repeat protein
VKWYRLAAEQGDVPAKFNLGIMYEMGHGVPRDYVPAHMWFNLAAGQGDEGAAKERDDIAGNKMTSDQIAEAQHLARAWKERLSRS